ncbi:hypothetical protein CDD83_417 [Cordyceps sp. RAO-2017]|nr:hypothetical protein CDD83_417 [Cordyceps sp. RAO-2017]
MMVSALFLLGLVGLAAASPAPPKSTGRPSYPETLRSKGFNLVVNVTNPKLDFKPSIQNTYVSSIHVGAGLALVGESPKAPDARVFYQNGTAYDKMYHKSTVVTDSGTPAFPSGIKLVKDGPSLMVSTARLDAGSGTPGIGIVALPEPVAYLGPETWAACNQSIPYYQGRYFIIFKQVNKTVDKDDGTVNDNMPKGCVPVRLVPKCAELNQLPKGSYSSHEYAIEDRCYKEPGAIKQWYTPPPPQN